MVSDDNQTAILASYLTAYMKQLGASLLKAFY